MKTKALLVVSFGTSRDENRELSFGAVERSLAAEFPDYEVRRAFTSRIIRAKLAERGEARIDGVSEALGHLLAEGIREAVVQPTFVIDGREYKKAAAEAAKLAGRFRRFALAAPLIASDGDCAELAEIMAAGVPGDTAAVYVGHGSVHPADSAYLRLRRVLAEQCRGNCFVGSFTGKAEPEGVIRQLRAAGFSKALLRPLLICAGKHVLGDMAGNSESSWKQRFETAGFEVSCEAEGLGQREAVRGLIARHAREAMATGRRA
ncbi:MAG: sirohydrochlorin cobaltochelatase [Oscillospiraceae bacterium]|jgi:sirohydrochlorin cobaltochelatase|nr:sirohydrochlorin cobaltochelatase [Oscillospiraceae bacterium]